MNKQQSLTIYFVFESFRPGQEPIVDRMLAV